MGNELYKENEIAENVRNKVHSAKTDSQGKKQEGKMATEDGQKATQS